MKSVTQKFQIKRPALKMTKVLERIVLLVSQKTPHYLLYPKIEFEMILDSCFSYDNYRWFKKNKLDFRKVTFKQSSNKLKYNKQCRVLTIRLLTIT